MKIDNDQKFYLILSAFLAIGVTFLIACFCVQFAYFGNDNANEKPAIEAHVPVTTVFIPNVNDPSAPYVRYDEAKIIYFGHCHIEFKTKDGSTIHATQFVTETR